MHNSIDQLPSTGSQIKKEVQTDSHGRNTYEVGTDTTLDLRSRIDSLRIENQSLRVKIEELNEKLNLQQDLRFQIRQVKRMIWQKFRTKSHSIKNSIIKQVENQQVTPIVDKSDRKFTPYKVKIIRPYLDNRLRILHIIANFYTGGSSQLVVDLVEHLGHKFEQIIICRDLPKKPSYIGLEVHQYKHFQNSHEALSMLEKIQPNLIHIHYLGHHRNDYSELDWKWYSAVFQAAEKYNCKIIENINIPTDPYISNQVYSYIFVSNYVNEEFAYLGSRNITIYPGSNLSNFCRKERDIPDDCIGMVYRLEGDKLNEEAIDVFIKVVQKRPQTKVLIIGGGRFLETYKKKAGQAGTIDSFIFTGYISYELLPSLYEQMSLFVAPVHTESFGQVTSFAMSMKIPVVGYNVGALKEIIEDEQLLATPGNSDLLADIIINLLEDREKRLEIGQKNYQRVQKLFSVEAMINSYNKLYDEALFSSQLINI